MNLLLLKLTIIPTVIGLVTLATRQWGPKIGGLIGSLPWTAGPILLFFILEQGKPFGIQAIQGIMTGILALLSFCFSYATFCRTLSWLPTLLLSFLIYTITALTVHYFQPDLIVGYVLGIGFILLTLRFFPSPTGPVTNSRRLPFEIPIRMGVATLFVLALTGLAHALGPTWSGILTPFPIMTTVLAVFPHMLQGSNATIATLRGLVMGLFGFSTFLFLQAYLLPEFSVAISFGLAFLVNLLMNILAGRR